MYRIDSANSVPALPTPAALGAEQFFRDGVAGSFDGTVVDADWLNMVQESLIDLLDNQAIAHSKSNYTGVTAAIASKIAAEVPAIVVANVDPHAIIALPTASDVVAGITEYADAGEASSTSSTRSVTPFALGANMVRLSVYNGWWTPPGGTMLFQWAAWNGVDDGDLVTLPLPFNVGDGSSWLPVSNQGNDSNEKGAHLQPTSNTQARVQWDSTSGTTQMCALCIGRR